MLRRQFPLVLLIASTYPFINSARADNIWQGSYSVDGQCFCSGEVSSSAASVIVPTPIGGQTVQQVCKKLGDGPGLTLQNGIFNYTVYKDPQCGHGPFESANGPRDPDCVGSIDGTYGSCQAAGPRWALAQAYSGSGSTTPEQNSVAKDNTAANASPGIAAALPDTTTVNVDSSMKEPAQSTQASGNTDFELAEFTGKSVVLGNDRYLQARKGLPVEGGAPGSRIILDGLLYLRLDADLNTADLFRAEPEVAAAEPEPPIKREKKREVANTNPVDKARVDAEAAALARLAKETAEREEQARADYIAERQARKARLAEQQALDARLAEQKALDEGLAEQKALEARLAEQKALDEGLAEQKALDARLAEQKALDEGLAEQKALEARLAEQEAIAKQESLEAEQSQAESAEKIVQQHAADSAEEQAVAEATKQTKAPGAESQANTPASMSALRLPAGMRASSRDFGYIEAMPAGFDEGGGGVVLEGSAQSNARFQYLARLGIAEIYQEVMIGGGYYVTPVHANRMTVVLLAGIEFGSFKLRDEEQSPRTVVNSDSGIYLGAMSRFVVNNKFELKGGVGYSSFFGGDPMLFGGGYYHVTPRLDVMSRFELGDNDLLGIGIRYYY